MVKISRETLPGTAYLASESLKCTEKIHVRLGGGVLADHLDENIRAPVDDQRDFTQLALRKGRRDDAAHLLPALAPQPDERVDHRPDLDAHRRPVDELVEVADEHLLDEVQIAHHHVRLEADVVAVQVAELGLPPVHDVKRHVLFVPHQVAVALDEVRPRSRDAEALEKLERLSSSQVAP